MPWNVIAQIGDDGYYPTLDPGEPRFVATIDQPGSTHSVTQHLLSEVFKAGLVPSQTAIDLSSCCRHHLHRGFQDLAWLQQRGCMDKRNLIHAPVADPALWNNGAPKLNEILPFLTGDEWAVHFRNKVRPHKTKLANPLIRAGGGVAFFQEAWTRLWVLSTCYLPVTT